MNANCFFRIAFLPFSQLAAMHRPRERIQLGPSGFRLPFRCYHIVDSPVAEFRGAGCVRWRDWRSWAAAE